MDGPLSTGRIHENESTGAANPPEFQRWVNRDDFVPTPISEMPRRQENDL